MSEIIQLPRITLTDAAVRPQLDFILPGLLAQSVGMIVGQGAIGKSFLALHIGFAMATGKPVAGGLWDVPKIGPTTIIMGEDDQKILQERLYWLRSGEQLTAEQAAAADRFLFVHSAKGYDMRIVEKTGGGYRPGPFLATLKHYCAGQRLAIIDPLLFLNGGGDENDNGAAAVLISCLYTICRETGCTIILLHHVGKSNGDREDWASARGASALTTSVRWQVNMTPPNKKEMEECGIDDEMRKSWVRVATVKSNYGDTGAASWLNRLKGGVLGWADKAKKEARPKDQSYAKASGGDDEWY
ncbi:AAA family ATPase [Gallionella capsiferriformans]|uniref:Putative DNA helicase n=1 Tax=Gallionella capsiferriformans (strain ES-2) TaxID=395494 RepID=D9SDU6_GALCS|nr:AAA family ATPase [Gallionella capsiferriformans]ADL54853.1 putative DNA helicase [Gallionella capsiferriformans ES-2]